MTRRQFLRAAAATAVLPAMALAKTVKPNFVFILADDLGWKDLSCYGSRFYETPNLDRLARQGMRFTNAYAAAPLCSPTRASIMTGKYPARLGMTNITQYRAEHTAIMDYPDSAKQLPLEEITIAEALKPAGYVSASIGKWHLGKSPYLPENQGFDLNVGGNNVGMPSAHFYPAWKESPRGPDATWAGVPIYDGQPGEYLADRLTDEALRFITANAARPFFLYLPHYAVHIPHEAKQEKIEKYKARVRADDPQNNPVYAGMVESVDESVGRVMAKLDELGIGGRTVVIFMSDNGGVVTPSANGTRSPATSNLPLREGKLTVYEGGIREPMIVRWPGVVKPNSVCDVPVISNDFFPTMVEIAGVRHKAPEDGLSLVPLLRGGRTLHREALYWHYPHLYGARQSGGAIRRGDYKLVEIFEDRHLELYNLRDDIGETKNLARQMPDKAAELYGMLQAWRKSVGAKMPVPVGEGVTYKSGASR